MKAMFISFNLGWMAKAIDQGALLRAIKPARRSSG